MWRKLQRNVRHRWVGGVCSGFARFIGLDIFPVRLLIRFLFVAFVPMFWWVYLILWILLPAQKLYEAEEVVEERPKSVYRPQVRVEVRRLEFDDVIEMTRDKVSERVFQKVSSIDASVRALLPHLTWWRSLVRPELAVVKRSALEYFPQALQHYLTLPRDYAENHSLMDGRTPEEKLLADLSLLETTLKNVLEGVYNNEKASVPADLKRLGERLGMNDPPSDDIGRTLDTLVTRVRGRVPDDILAKVMSLRTAITAVVPQISEMGAGTTREAYNVRQTALEYLPDALDKYLSLPEGFAETHVLSNGKTAKETLLEQLELLDETMKDMVGDVYQEDADALLIHGRFLKEKFAGHKFTLPADEAPEGIKFPEVKLPEREKVRIKL
ncbi:MAG: PspC domain-containing protein [Deinococcota bacterium]|jgi:phage shock protein PspC (stress-responsive transcriptional regulator)|nr:PspC domain-containing protein [Deinococcota bacterium]